MSIQQPLFVNESEREWAHPSGRLWARRAGHDGIDYRDVEIVGEDEMSIAYHGNSDLLCWLGAGERALLVGGGTGSQQLVQRLRAPDWSIEVQCDVTDVGCPVQNLGVSGNAHWAVLGRYSGQGECGFDLFDVRAMSVVDSLRAVGCLLPRPAFSSDGSRVAVCYGPLFDPWWLGPGWDEPDEPSVGGVLPFAYVGLARLDGSPFSWTRLEVEVPKGFRRDDLDDTAEIGVGSIELLEEGVRITLPGGEAWQHAAPLGAVVRVEPWSFFDEH